MILPMMVEVESLSDPVTGQSPTSQQDMVVLVSSKVEGVVREEVVKSGETVK